SRNIVAVVPGVLFYGVAQAEQPRVVVAADKGHSIAVEAHTDDAATGEFVGKCAGLIGGRVTVGSVSEGELPVGVFAPAVHAARIVIEAYGVGFPGSDGRLAETAAEAVEADTYGGVAQPQLPIVVVARGADPAVVGQYQAMVAARGDGEDVADIRNLD